MIPEREVDTNNSSTQRYPVSEHIGEASSLSENNAEEKRNSRSLASSLTPSEYIQQNPVMRTEPDPIGRITSEGANNEYIRIGHQKYLKRDLYEAFGGTLQPGIAPPPVHRFGNPAPLGLSGFAATTFMLSLINTKAQGVTIPNAVVGPGMFYGGLVQLIAGVWEIAVENTFGGTTLSSFGGFWMAFSAFYIPWFGVAKAYEGNEGELGSAMGFFLLAMTIFSLGLTICGMKSTVSFLSMLIALDLTFLLLSIAEFTGKFGIKRAGGVMGMINASLAWYNAFAGLATPQNSYLNAISVRLPANEYTLTSLPRKRFRHPHSGYGG